MPAALVAAFLPYPKPVHTTTSSSCVKQPRALRTTHPDSHTSIVWAGVSTSPPTRDAGSGLRAEKAPALVPSRSSLTVGVMPGRCEGLNSLHDAMEKAKYGSG